VGLEVIHTECSTELSFCTSKWFFIAVLILTSVVIVLKCCLLISQILKLLHQILDLKPHSQQNRNPRFEKYYRPFFWAWNQIGGVTYFGYFCLGLCSATSFKRSRQSFPFDVAEHTSMLKKYRNMHYPRFSFIPKIGIAFPKRRLCFYCVLQPNEVIRDWKEFLLRTAPIYKERTPTTLRITSNWSFDDSLAQTWPGACVV